MGISDILKPKSINEINETVQNFLQKFESFHLPKNFKWRKGQREAVEQIIQTYLEEKYKVVILDAPVGSGKSLIAMASAFILNDIGKRGYILASEISLQDQYESDIERYYLPWGSVKGVDNYICVDNLEKYSLGTCQIRDKSPQKMPCYLECPYLSARNLAIRTETSVLNYNYWLIMQNTDNSLFKKRNFTICDEAHKILDIVQNHYSPRFTEHTTEKLQQLSDFFKNYKVGYHNDQVNEISNSLKELWSRQI